MSHKHPTSLRRARLAPLAAAAALIAATSGVALAQTQQFNVTQSNIGIVKAPIITSGQITSFPDSGVVTVAPITSLAIGNEHQIANGAQAALTINTQPLAQPTVTVVQQVTGEVSGSTNTNIGINANNVQGNHDGDTASVSGNRASSDTIGNTSVGTMLITGTAVDVSSAATTSVNQGVAVNAPISASTNLTRVGIHLDQTGGNAMNNLSLSAAGNQVDSSAQANTTQAGIRVEASSVNIGADTSSTVEQQAAGNVTADSNVNLVGIRVLGSPTLALTNSQLGVSSNSVQAAAGGNQQTSVLQINAAGDVVQTGGTGLTNSATQTTSGAIEARSIVNTLGIDNQKPGSLENRYSVSGNDVGAQADGNSGSNRTGIAAAGAITGAQLETSNTQTIGGSVSANAQVMGHLGVQTVDSTNDALTVSANRVDAQAQGSSASNQTRAGASDIRDSLASTSNTQTHAGGAVSANASALGIGSSSTILSGSSLTVSGNQLSAEATAASVSNDALLGADNAVTQSVATVGNTQLHLIGDVQANARSNVVGASADSASNAALVVSGNQFSATAASQKADNLARVNATNGVSDSGAGIVSVQGHVAGAVNATVAGSASTSPAPNPDPMLIGLRSGAALGGNLTVSGNQGGSDAIVNQVDNQVALSGSRIDGNSGAYLFNVQAVQSGNAQALTRVDLGVAGSSPGTAATRSGGHELVVSGNKFSSNASQNQATNALDINATSTLSADFTQQPNLLGNLQLSAGNTTATTEVRVLSGSSLAADPSGNTTITGNQASSMARANVANNQLNLTAGTMASDQLALLGNVQDNTGTVTSTASLQMQGSAANRLNGNVSSSANQAQAVAVGNTSLNSVRVSAGTALNSGTGVVLLNEQSNGGNVVATASLNADAFTRGGSLNLSGNTVSATAVGNNAENVVNVSALPGQQMASAVLTSNQVNSGNVTAAVNGSFNASGTASTSGINVSGNRSSAVAIGNRTTSSMTLGVQ